MTNNKSRVKRRCVFGVFQLVRIEISQQNCSLISVLVVYVDTVYRLKVFYNRTAVHILWIRRITGRLRLMERGSGFVLTVHYAQKIVFSHGMAHFYYEHWCISTEWMI